MSQTLERTVAPWFALVAAISLGVAASLIILAVVFRLITVEIRRRNRAEAALKRSEIEARMLAMVASQTHDAVMILDARWRIEWINDAFTRITEYQPQEVVGQKAALLFHGPGTDAATSSRLREDLRGGRSCRVEVQHHARSGRRYWVELEALPITVPSGATGRIIVIMSDIKGRRRSEARLAVQHAWTRILSEATSLEKAMPRLLMAISEKPEVEVVAWVEVETLCDAAVASRFSVSDTGIGIPNQKRRTIFEPFQQTDGSTTRKYGGTGLGLSILAKLVALMSGRIWVEGAVGRGSTFYFTAAMEREDEIGEPDQATSITGLRVLVVDGNDPNRRILEEILSNWGARPATAFGRWDEARDAFEDLRRALDRVRPTLEEVVAGVI